MPGERKRVPVLPAAGNGCVSDVPIFFNSNLFGNLVLFFTSIIKKERWLQEAAAMEGICEPIRNHRLWDNGGLHGFNSHCL